MKKCIIVVFAVMFSISAMAQHGLNPQIKRHGLGAQKSEAYESNTSSVKGLEKSVEASKKSVNTFNLKNNIVTIDSAYYKNIVKKNGWFVGVGKELTHKEIIHLNCYYKLSKKNKAGNWTYIEALDGYGKPTIYHNIGTYLANQYDEEDKGLNNDWRDRLQTVCKWELVADPSGKEVVQERALNSEGGVVYIFNPVKIGVREYAGSFTDSWGMPIYMRSDSLGNDAGYANFIHITRDERGYEVLFKYFDRFGYPQKNKDGAYMTQKAYDDDGNQIKEASLNIVGDYMIDDYGNCGWEYKFKDGRQIEAKYFNADWEPMLFPNNRGEGYKVYGFRYETDEFGRDTALIVINKEGGDAVDEDFGFQRLVKRYNDHGQQILQAFYDEKGNLVAGDKYGIAQVVLEFDSLGNQLSVEYRDSECNLVNSENGYCKYEFGNYIDRVNNTEIGYRINSENELIKTFEFSRDKSGNAIRKWHTDNQVKIDSVDSKGRNVLIAWYDLHGNPVEFEGMHKNVTVYDDANNVEVETWLDKDEEPFVDDERGYSKDISITDNSNYVLTNYQYWNGFLKQSFQKQFTPGFESIISQWDITPYGEHARVGWWNNLHYKCNVDYTMYGDIRTMVGRNEFDEPSYLTFLGTSGEVYYFSDLNNGNRRYYDEFGVEIPDSMMEDFKSSLPRVYCIEVTDTSIAYPLGLRNGDVIISYGGWMVNKDLKTDVVDFYLETILKATDEKPIVLLRHHPEEKSSEIVVRYLPKGRTSDLGFYPHMIYYTQKEAKRLKETCATFSVILGGQKKQKDKMVLLAVQVKGGFESSRLYHLPQYDVKDAGIVLYAKERYDKGVDTWSLLTDPIEKWEERRMFYIKNSNLYLTQDLSTTRHIYKQSRGYGGMKFVPVMVDDSVYNELLRCYQTLEGEFYQEDVAQQLPRNAERMLVGKWTTILSEDNVSCKVILELTKKKIMNVCLEAVLEGEIQPGLMMKINMNILATSGAWNIDEALLQLDMSAARHECEISNIEIIGLDDEEMLKELRLYIEQNKHELASSIIDIFEDVKIKSLTRKELVLMSNGEFLDFVRIR